MNQNKKLNLQLIIAAILVVIGCGLLIAGFMVPPLGVIDSSVLVAFGETSTFVAAILGIDYKYKYKAYKNSLTIRDEELEEEQ